MDISLRATIIIHKSGPFGHKYTSPTKKKLLLYKQILWKLLYCLYIVLSITKTNPNEASHHATMSPVQPKKNKHKVKLSPQAWWTESPNCSGHHVTMRELLKMKMQHPPTRKYKYHLSPLYSHFLFLTNIYHSAYATGKTGFLFANITVKLQFSLDHSIFCMGQYINQDTLH